LADSDAAKIEIARTNGIVGPEVVMAVARRLAMPFYVLCAYLEQETGGGHNIWGNDDTWMRGRLLRPLGLEEVTKSSYLIYKLHRSRFGNQGVGPLQLTHPSIQDAADANGGCWDPATNIATGAGLIMSFLDSEGSWHGAALRYNGGEAYAVHNDELRAKWRDLILGAT
jgi:hypothetical protein